MNIEPQSSIGIRENINGLLTTAQAAAYLGYKQRMLEGRRVRGGGPLFVAISQRAVRYRIEDLQDWVAARIKSSTSEGENHEG